MAHAAFTPLPLDENERDNIEALLRGWLKDHREVSILTRSWADHSRKVSLFVATPSGVRDITFFAAQLAVVPIHSVKSPTATENYALKLNGHGMPVDELFVRVRLSELLYGEAGMISVGGHL